jgi:hypothetical protein
MISASLAAAAKKFLILELCPIQTWFSQTQTFHVSVVE